MPAQARKRSLSLEILILALVERGQNTPYALRETAGISLGASIPALRRLQETGEVTHRVAGRRHEFVLTPAGRKRLKTSWESDLKQHVPSEYDAILRSGYLFWLLSDDKKDGASQYLREAAKARGRFAADRRAKAEQLLAEFEASSDGNLYRWMRALSEAARASTDAVTLRKIAKTLERRRPK
jgi:DNA-binding PadR family transcriptional regulator